MDVFATLGFAAAVDKVAGDYVAVGGVARRVLDVVREGRDWPLYRLDGLEHGISGLESVGAPGYVSYRYCGDAR